MTKEEMAKRIQELEQALDKANASLSEERRKNYEMNAKLDETIALLNAYKEKYDIERTRKFISKGERIEEITINETEEIIKKEKKTNKGKKYKKRFFDYEKYVQEIRYIEPEEKICPKCGTKLVIANEKIRYAVEVIPSQIKVIKFIKRTYKCPHCNKIDAKIFYPLVDEPFNGSILTPSLASFIMYHKYELGIPFHHLSQHLTKSLGFELSKQSLANYMAKASNLLEPIYDQMKDDLVNDPIKVMHSDETTLVVSKKDEENIDRKKSYVYVYNSSYYSSKQIRIYDFHESRKIDETAKWLQDYQGVIHCDDYKGYDSLKKSNQNIQLQKCFAHVRRRYADIVKSLPSKAKKDSKAYEILKCISLLFELEKNYRKKKLNPDLILEARRKDMPNIIKKLEELVFTANPVKGSALDGAINYTKNCWPDLFTFMENGYVELTNNAAERSVKPFVVQRKVFQTSGSYAGARYTTKIFSIIQTCKINNINVEKYIEYVLNNINKLKIEDLTPYSEHIKNIIKE